MVIGIAFAEMVIALRTTVPSLEAGRENLSLQSIQDVWKSVLIFGLMGILLSWTRKKPEFPQDRGDLSSPLKG
jgi:hypothetical protein